MHGPFGSGHGTSVGKKPQLASASDQGHQLLHIQAICCGSQVPYEKHTGQLLNFAAGDGFLDAQECPRCHVVTCACRIISPGLGTPSPLWVWAFHKAMKTTLLHYNNTTKQLYNYD